MLLELEKGASGRTLLDIGCSFGWMLDEASRRGWQAVGVEPSASAAGEAKDAGLEVLEGHFPHPGLTGRRFDVVTLMDVFEHLPDPVRTLMEIRAVLDQRGLLAIKLPNSLGPIYRIASRLSQSSLGILTSPLARMYQLGSPYPHLFYYCESNLCRLLEGNGFGIVRSYEEAVIERQGILDRLLYAARTDSDRLWLRFQAVGLSGLLVLVSAASHQDIFTVIARKRG